MDRQQIREQFIEMYGYDEFKQWTFVLVNSLGTNHIDDHYWLKWKKFMEVNKEIPDSFSEVRWIFLYCHVHKKELLQDQIKRPFYDKKILQRITHRKRTSEWYDAAEKSFPYGHGGLETICTECVVNHLQWIDNSKHWDKRVAK